jgi:uncharacterized protein YwqG
MTEPDLKLEPLKQKLSHLRRSAWKPIVREGDGALTSSKFAGTPWLNASELWLVCPNCNKPMQLFLQLNLDELPEALKGKFGRGLLQFFYCTNYEPHCDCDCCGWEPFSNIKIVRIVQPSNLKVKVEISEPDKSFPAKLIEDWEEVDDYPDFQTVETCETTINEEESNILLENNITVTGDKLAGWPEWVQYPEYPDCPTCHQPMKQFVFQIDSEDNLPYMWGDVGVGYVLQCSIHKEQLAFLWQCG